MKQNDKNKSMWVPGTTRKQKIKAIISDILFDGLVILGVLLFCCALQIIWLMGN